jgi:glycosyltransferase involved in cell wall biosynthesis
LLGSLASALSGLPLVHHVHSPTSQNTAHALSDRVNTMVERVALRRARALIPVSHDLAGYLRREGFAHDRMTVVHNGVAPSECGVRREPHGELRIGMVALFRPRKGLEVLIRALAELLEQGMAVRLRAVGEFESPEYEQAIRALAEERGVSGLIDWRGFCEDVRPELERMDLLVLPSLYGEGLPMVILEAMAAGLPVVASRVGGVAELVRNGQDGLLVEPGDAAELSRALALFATQPDTLRAIGSEGQRRQRLEFSSEAMARRLSRIYDAVIARAGAGTRRQSRTRVERVS